MHQLRSALQILVDWANSQQNWVRAIVAEVLATRGPLSPESLRRIYYISLAERGLSAERAEQVPALTSGVSSPEERETFQLLVLRDVENVNRLAPGQEIKFNRGMTVLFGENATGKSGYVRILKRLAAVRLVEEILSETLGTLKPRACLRRASNTLFSMQTKPLTGMVKQAYGLSRV
jgi:hypothetical protein